MADSHSNDGVDSSEEGGDVEQHDSSRDGLGRRAFVKSVGVAAGALGAGPMVGDVSAAPGIEKKLSKTGEVRIPPGKYSWDGGDLDVEEGDALIGAGKPGGVVLNLESGTMRGSIEGRLENVTVRGANQDSQSGLRIQPGATIDGFLWPEGGQEDEDMALYTSDGGEARVIIRNSGWAWMVNNGAYLDKPPVTIENCVAANNNIAGVRVGHRDGTPEGETTYVRNSLIAVTRDIPNDDSGSSNGRGLRIRHPGNFVVENCWFVSLDVDGSGDQVVFHDEAAGANVTIRDCAFYNDSDAEILRDKTEGDVDLTVENCTVEGSGSREVDADFSGSGFTEASAEYPLPSKVTGLPAADEIEGVGSGNGPWN